MKEKKEELQIVAVPEQYAPEALIAQGIEKGLTIEMMEKLFAMRKELRAEQAKNAFDQALADFQAECPVIEKEKHVNFKTRAGDTVDYYYAPIDAIVRQVQGALGRNGLSYKFKLEETPKGIKATCILTHRLGHSETSDFTADMAGTSLMSNAQIASSKATFAKRNAFCNVTGIVTGDDDIDGQKTLEETKNETAATQEQKDEIDALAQQASMTKAEVVTRCRQLYGISYTEITSVQASGIIEGLKKRVKEKQANSGAASSGTLI